MNPQPSALRLPGAVAQAYNPSYLGGWDQEDGGLRTAWQKVHEIPYLNQWLATMACTCHPKYNRRIMIQASLAINVKTLSQNKAKWAGGMA
jgi:hypothetical protein